MDPPISNNKFESVLQGGVDAVAGGTQRRTVRKREGRQQQPVVDPQQFLAAQLAKMGVAHLTVRRIWQRKIQNWHW